MCHSLQHIAKENPTRRKVSGALEKERDVPLVATHREGESDAPQSEQHARKGGMCHWLQHTAKENPTRRKVSSTPEREGCATGCSTPRRRIRRAAKLAATPEREGCATGCSTPRRRIRTPRNVAACKTRVGMCHSLQYIAKENSTRRNMAACQQREGCATRCSTPRGRIQRAAM